MRVTASIESNIKEIHVVTECNDVRVVTLSRKQITAHLTMQPINLTVNKIGDDNGYVLLKNDLHTVDNPFVVNANEPFVFPLRNDSGVYHQAPDEFQNIIDNDTNKIVVINTWDKWSYSIQFTLKTALSDRFGSTIFNIGGLIADFTPSYFDGSRDAGLPKIISIPLQFFQGETFTANGGEILGNIDGAAEIYDLQVIATRDVKGKPVS